MILGFEFVFFRKELSGDLFAALKFVKTIECLHFAVRNAIKPGVVPESSGRR